MIFSRVRPESSCAGMCASEPRICKLDATFYLNQLSGIRKMKSLLISLLILSLYFLSCKKNNTETYFFKAKVVQTSDVSCYLPVLDFSEDSLRIRTLTKRNDINYSVVRLPSSFNVQNKKLYVSVAALQPEEEFPCNTLGISYPHLKILDVSDRE